MSDQTTDVIDAAVKMSPPVVVSFCSAILNVPIEKWVSFLTLIYIGIQVFLLIRDRVVRRRRKSDDEEDEK